VIPPVAELPATRVKAHREHRIPLSARALAVLDEMRAARHGDTGDAFVSRRQGRQAPPLGTERPILVLPVSKYFVSVYKICQAMVDSSSKPGVKCLVKASQTMTDTRGSSEATWSAFGP
jgi:hypothetical protein